MISFRYQADAENFFRTTDRIERQLGTLEKSASGFGTVLKGALLGVGFAVAQKGLELVTGAFSGSIGAASTFEKTMSGVKAVSGATAAELGQLSSLALQLGKDTSFSASEAAAGIEELVKGGVKIPDIMGGAAQAVLNLAAAGGVSLPDAAEIAANAMNIFSLNGSDMAHVSDLVAGAANASSLSVTDFKFSMAAAGSMAAVAGLSFDDLAQGIAIMGAAGIKGSDAGTSLKTMLTNLIPQTGEQRKLFRDLGLQTDNLSAGFKFLAEKGIAVAGDDWAALNSGMMQYLGYSQDTTTWTDKQRKEFDKLYTSTGTISSAFFDQNGKMKSLADVAGILQTATKDMTEQQKLATFQTLFGSDASRAAAIFAKSGAQGFNEMAAAMGNVTAAGVAADRLDNVSGSLEQLKGSLETAGITIGMAFLPMLRGVIDWGTRAVNAAIPLLETYGPVLAAKVTEGGKALLGFGRDAVAMLGPVKDAAGGLLQAFQTGDFNSAFGPLLAALDAVFGPGTSGKVAKFTSDLLGGFQLVRDGFITVQQALAGKWVGDDTVQPAVRAVGDFALRLRDFALTAKDVFFNQVLPAVQQVAGFIRDHMDTIAKVVAIGAAAFAAFSIIATVVGWVTSAIAIWGVLSVAIEGVGGIVAALVIVLGGPLTLAIAAIVGVVTLLGLAWANNWGDIQGKVAAVWAWLQPVLADLGARLSQFWTDILPQLSAAWESVSTKVVAAATWLWGMLQTVFGAVAGFLVAHGDQIVAVLGGAWALIQNTINTYLGVIGNLIRGVLALISGDWDGAWAYIQQAAQIAWNGLVALFTAAGPILLGVLAAIWGGIQAAAGAAWDAIAGYVGSKFSEIGTTIRDRLTQYKNDTGQQFSDLGTAIQDKLAAIGTAIGGKFSAIGTTIHDRVAQYLVDTGQQFSDMGTAVRDTLTTMKNDVGDRFSALGAAIRGKLDDIQGWWRDRWTAVSSFVSGIWDGIVRGVTGALGDLWSGVTGKVADLRSWLNDRWADIKATALNAWNSMVGQIVQAVINLGVTILIELAKTEALLLAIFVRIARNGLDKATDLYNWVTGKVGDLASWVGGKIADLRDTLGGLWDSAYTKAAGVWATLWKTVTQAASDVRDDLTARITTARDWLTGLWNSIYTKATQAWSGVRDFAAQIAADMQAKITGPIDAAKAWLDGTWNSIYTKATSAWDGVRSWLLQTAAEMQSRITGPIDVAKALLDTAWGSIYTKATDAWNGVRSWLLQTAGDMQARVTTPIDAAKAMLDTTWANIYQKAIDAWNGVRQWLWDTGSDLRDRITMPITSAKDALIGTWQNIYDTATGKWGDLKKLLWDNAGNMKDALLSPFNGAKDAIGGIVNAFGNGIINSLNGAGDRVRKFGDGVRSIINWIAERLGAGGIADQSPSFSLPGLATGTRNWGGGMAWVGEGPGGAGAELAYLPRGAQVLPHRDSMALVRQGVVTAPQSGPALVPGFAGGLDALGGIFGVLQKGAGWLYDQAKGAVGLGDLSLPGALGDIGAKMAGKVKDWALGSIDKMLKAATPKTPIGGASGEYIFPVPGYENSFGPHWDGSPSAADIMSPEGSRIVATRGGRASGPMEFPLGGNTITVYGDDGLQYYYAHMRDPASVSGAVATGQQLGWVGRTGNAYKGGTGAPHLHIGIGPEITSAGDGGSFDAYNLLRDIAGGKYATKTGPGDGSGPFTGNGSTVVDAILGKVGNDSYTGLAMLMGSHMEGGWGPTFGAGDNGQSFGPYQIYTVAHPGVSRAQAEDPVWATDFMYADYRAATRRGDLPWGTDPAYAGARAAYYAERPRDMYPGDRIAGAWGDSRGIVGMADGGVITEPIVGRGQRSGRSYTFGENGKEAIFNADQLAALSPRSEKGGDTHIANYTIVSSTPEITVDQLKREERREARLRGYR